jgi:ubiquitin-protein ligase
MTRRINNLYTLFLQSLNDVSIADYFQIKNYTYALTQNSPTAFTFTMHGMKLHHCVFQQLPIDLSIHISKYLYEKTNVVYSLVFPMDYPFKHPMWSLVEDTSNTKIRHEYASHFMNKQHEVSWSPSITLEKNVLNMIECLLVLTDS